MNKAQHLAIIMDGNGRWAKARGQNRTKGHEKGAEVIRTISEYAANHPQIAQLTLYAFSTENWKRPKTEVDFLMKLLERYLDSERDTYLKNSIRFNTIGDLSVFSPKLQAKIAQLKTDTAHGEKLLHTLAFNYGAHDEITRAAQKLQASQTPITVESLTAALDMPTPVDLLLRTGGDMRLSNFLLWQASYAELFFTPTLWPDFTAQELDAILSKFAGIERRFGGI
ncbi:MAG: UDP pyrophosphate synthase [Sulfuricurvum sp. PC08-66]|nr:MAG: UDP pyrophosphate synthase [Sulfuricurvum sp. PC08-66]